MNAEPRTAAGRALVIGSSTITYPKPVEHTVHIGRVTLDTILAIEAEARAAALDEARAAVEAVEWWLTGQCKARALVAIDALREKK